MMQEGCCHWSGPELLSPSAPQACHTNSASISPPATLEQKLTKTTQLFGQTGSVSSFLTHLVVQSGRLVGSLQELRFEVRAELRR